MFPLSSPQYVFSFSHCVFSFSRWDLSFSQYVFYFSNIFLFSPLSPLISSLYLPHFFTFPSLTLLYSFLMSYLSLPPSLLSCLQVVDVYKSQATARAAKILIENLVLHPMKVRVTCICLSVCQLFSLFVLLPFALYLFCPIFFSLSLSFSL